METIFGEESNHAKKFVSTGAFYPHDVIIIQEAPNYSL